MSPARSQCDAEQLALGLEPAPCDLVRSVPAVATASARNGKAPPIPAVDALGLTKIELRMLQHAAQGLTDKQIASVVGRATKTVRHHLRQVRKKMEVRTRFQLGIEVSGLLTKDRGNA